MTDSEFRKAIEKYKLSIEPPDDYHPRRWYVTSYTPRHECDEVLNRSVVEAVCVVEAVSEWVRLYGEKGKIRRRTGCIDRGCDSNAA